MLRLHDHHVEPSLLAKFNKQRGNTLCARSSGSESVNDRRLSQSALAARVACSPIYWTINRPRTYLPSA